MEQNDQNNDLNSQDKLLNNLVPYSKVSKTIRFSSNSKFSKASIVTIQHSITKFIEELAELSEKQSRIRCRKLDKNQAITIQKEDVLTALLKGGKKFHFINSCTEFLDDNFWDE